MSGIDSYILLKYLHILLFVFWLGTDLGVLLAARRIRDPSLSAGQRMTLLELAFAIDFLPRLAFTLMLPVGLSLARSSGLVSMPAWGLALVWLACLLWLGLTLALAATAGRPVQARLARVQRLWLLVVTMLCLTAAALALYGALPLPGWLAAKIALFGLIAAAAIAIDRAFMPLVPAMAELIDAGSSPALEARIRAAIDPALRFVYSLYALLLLSGLLGVSK